MSSGSTCGRGGGDAKTIISPNISFGDIIKYVYTIDKLHVSQFITRAHCRLYHIPLCDLRLKNSETRSTFDVIRQSIP